MIIIIFGVSGSGKTTIGQQLSSYLEIPFYDGDDFHPENSIQKMSKGIPLNDSDRAPWLSNLAQHLVQCEFNGGAILACSALKASYRKQLSSQLKEVQWIFLRGSFDQLETRLEQRKNHFMKKEMLQSQFDTLEVPTYGLHVDISTPPYLIIQEIINYVIKTH
ncbi:MAG: gluconokinase [Saprospiraceae bacterium]